MRLFLYQEKREGKEEGSEEAYIQETNYIVHCLHVETFDKACDTGPLESAYPAWGGVNLGLYRCDFLPIQLQAQLTSITG